VRDRVGVLRRHWLVALLTFAVVLAASVGSFLVIDPVYRSEAEVLLRTQDSQQLFPRTSGTTVGGLVRSPGAEVEYTSSDAFQDLAVAGADGGGEIDVEVLNELRSSVLVFTAEDDDAETAAATAQAWADTYVTRRHEIDVAETTRLRDLLVAERAAVDAERQAVLRPLAALDEAITAETDSADLSQLLTQRLALERSLAGALDPLEAEVRRIDGQIATLGVDLRVLEDPNALAVVSRAAVVPESQINGSMTQSLAVGILGGLVLGAVAASAADRLRRR
jgi:uncharacterized protein involved in exopolysaccharide biosynthesis